MAVKWTDEQQQALKARPNVLVNAAAGSGKTAVLVERLCSRIVQGELSADRILAVTFTKAAAGELRTRIMTSLETAAKNTADSIQQKRLLRQMTLAAGADILTIDSFCLKAVRSYFHALDIDPNFAVADQGESAFLREEVMEELFAELYEAEDEEFLELADNFAGARGDEGLASAVLKVFELCTSIPHPGKWLEEKARMYEGPFCGSPWYKELMRERKQRIDRARASYKSVIGDMLGDAVGFYGDVDNVLERYTESDPALCEKFGKAWTAARSEYEQLWLVKADDWDCPVNIKSVTMSGCRDHPRSYYKDRVNECRKEAKKCSGITEPSLAEAEKMRERAGKNVAALARLVELFAAEYDKKKKSRNIMEFYDVEQLALRLFEENEEAREEYRAAYDEILIDEYQDTNGLQDAIFSAIANERSLFLVGDMKQSIYRFRNSDPLIFKRKNDAYSPDPAAENRRIVLSKNFRSRIEILDSTNDIFSRVMSEEVGEISYNEDQRLNLGDTSYEYKNPPADYVSELYVIENSSEEELESTRAEARFIAGRIRELKESGFLVRDKSGDYRPVRNSDIAILSSAVRTMDAIYLEELENAGIEAYAESRGYFQRAEIKLMTSFLKIISNPRQDIPLLGVLRSPIGGFDDEELADIRMADEGAFINALEAAASREDGTGEKAGRFLDRLSHWRELGRSLPADELVWRLYEETDLYNFAGAYYGGVQAQANLQLLFTRARIYEKSGFSGLFRFIRYIERMESASQDLSGASQAAETHDAVRIMTIHKSKGLEFPVVILAGGGKGFRLRTDGIALHKDWGFGLRDMTPDHSVSTPMERVVRGAIHREQLAEEMRKLYVALTRAKEKLIVTGVLRKGKNAEEEIESWRQGADPAEATSFFGWLCPASLASGNWQVKAVKPAAAEDIAAEKTAEEEISPAAAESVEKILGWEYPRPELCAAPTKISVTDIKMIKQQQADEEEQRRLSQLGDEYFPVYKREELAKMPAFMAEKKGVSGAALGTLFHAVMARIPPETDAAGYMRALVLDGELTEEEAEAVPPEWVDGFFASPLGERIKASRRFERETPFEIEIDAGELEKRYEGAVMLLQGIIDCWFEEDDGAVLVDYKTDRYKSPEELAEKYALQLEYYSRAIERTAGMQVKEAYLYLARGQKLLRIDVR